MLSHYLASELFTFVMVFCRLGSALMLMPGFAETYVTSRARLWLALLLSLIVNALNRHQSDLLAGAILTVEAGRLRIRRLPRL